MSLEAGLLKRVAKLESLYLLTEIGLPVSLMAISLGNWSRMYSLLAKLV